jgi:hypothetical protein
MWDKEKFEFLICLEVTNCIIDMSLFDVVEKLFWVDSIHGQYSVKIDTI